MSEEIIDNSGPTDQEIQDIRTIEEIRVEMNRVLDRQLKQRAAFVEAARARAEKYARTHLAICLMDEDYLHTDESRAIMRKLKTAIEEKKHKTLSLPDKHALLTVDLGDLQVNYDLAELMVKQDDIHYRQLNAQLMFYMNERKHIGPIVSMGFEKGGPAAVDKIYKQLEQPSYALRGVSETSVPYDEEQVGDFNIPLEEHTPQEVAQAIADGVLDPTKEAVEYANPFLDKVTPDPARMTDEAFTADEAMPAIPRDKDGAPLGDPPSEEPHWIDDLSKTPEAVPDDPTDVKKVKVVAGNTIGSLYGRETGAEYNARKEASKEAWDSGQPTVATEDGIMYLAPLTPTTVVAEICAGETIPYGYTFEPRVLGPRDDEANPFYVDPETGEQNKPDMSSFGVKL